MGSGAGLVDRDERELAPAAPLAFTGFLMFGPAQATMHCLPCPRLILPRPIE